jgi:hypothetical protein
LLALCQPCSILTHTKFHRQCVTSTIYQSNSTGFFCVARFEGGVTSESNKHLIKNAYITEYLAMTTEDIIIDLFCRIDDQMQNVPNHSQAALLPSELVVTIVLSKALGNGHFTAG